jgi:peptidoglycan/LPS O-acetylase OafA/YrhL
MSKLNPFKNEHSGGARHSGGLRYLADGLRAESNSFGVVRIAMALAVLVSHSYLLARGTSSAEPLHSLTGHSLGEHAVQVFFFLSGILVAQSFDRSRSTLDFVAGRILRIFPGLIVCVLLTALALGPVMSMLQPTGYFSNPLMLRYIARTLSLSTGSAPLPGVFEAHPLPSIINMSLWTLKYEVLCYAGLALAGAVGLFSLRWRKVSTSLLAVFLVLVFIEQPKAIETYTSIDNIRYFALFFGAGTLAYLIRDWLPVHGAAVIPLFAIFTFALGTRFGELATALFLGYATLWVATLSFGPLRALTNRYDLSYGAYIYACPIQQMLIEKLPGIDPLLSAALAIIIVLPIAFLSWVLVERPALKQRFRVTEAVSGTLRRYLPLPASKKIFT